MSQNNVILNNQPGLFLPVIALLKKYIKMSEQSPLKDLNPNEQPFKSYKSHIVYLLLNIDDLVSSVSFLL